jgi:polyisoprenyl-phosphate glycosyltransferase
MLSVVIPALNEEAAIGETIEVIREHLTRAAIEHEIIVISDGSSDRTAAIAHERGAVVIEHPAPGGYGRSLKDGIAAAKHALIGITDADGTYPNERLVELYELCAGKGFDMAVGARTGPHYKGTFLKMPARRVFAWLSEYATGTKIPDINSGLRVFRKELVTRYEHTISNGFSFTTTITLAALLNGYFVTHVPIEYFKRKGSSHVRYWRDTIRALQIIVESILYYNPLKLFLLLVMALLVVALGAAVATFLVPDERAGLLAALLATASFVGSFIVAAVGLSAVLSRFAERKARLFVRTPTSHAAPDSTAPAARTTP